MSLEKDMRKRVVAALRDVHAVSVENGAGAGTPDVNCALGWLELKSIDELPARPETPVRVPHFSPEQRLWLTKRCRAGGAAWMLIKAGREWILLWGETAALIVDCTTAGELREAAIAVFSSPEDDLLPWLIRSAERNASKL